MPTGNGNLRDIQIAEEHDHPPLSAVTPRAKYRRGAITFGSAAAGENVIMGFNANLITYNFVAALGAPGANVVEVKVQGTVDLTIRKLADAVQGVTDVANIAYGAGTKPNPDIMGAYTSQQIAIGSVLHAAGSTLYVRFKVGDLDETTYPVTLSTTTAGPTLTTFTKIFSMRYAVPGGGADINNHIAGPYQTIFPPRWIVDGNDQQVRFDPNIIIVERASNGSAQYEADIYWSTDEITFNEMISGLPLSFAGVGAGSQQYRSFSERPPAGAGVYIKVRCSSNSNEDIDVVVQYHQYPYGL